jgi:hypothetical protein
LEINGSFWKMPMNPMHQANGLTNRTVLKYGTLNIRHHGNGNIYQALKTIRELNLDFGFLTEIKANNPAMFVRLYAGYCVAEIAPGGSLTQGGVCFFWREESERFLVESVHNSGQMSPHVCLFLAAYGGKRWGFTSRRMKPMGLC